MTAGFILQPLLSALLPDAAAGPHGSAAREALALGVAAGLGPEAAALMHAITLGVRDDLGPLRAAFAASGLAHVLALSGLHVGILAAAANALLAGLGRWRTPVVVVGVWAYVLTVGATPSLARAALMISSALVAHAIWGARVHWPVHLLVALTLSLAYQPAWITNLGFALSYLSVLGIGVGMRPLAALFKHALLAARRTPRPPSALTQRAITWLSAALAVTVSAQAATASLVASAFGGIPLVAPLTNLLAVPLATLLVPLGMLAALAGLLGEPVAAAVNLLTRWPADALIALARFSARAPMLPWGAITPLGHAAYALALAGAAAALHGIWRPWRAWLLALAMAAVTLVTPTPWSPPDLIALDVGQGDAIVVRLGGGQGVLIDGGGTPFSDFDVGARVVLPQLRRLGVMALPLVVATHADLDHMEGLVAVLTSLPVGALIIGHPAPERAVFQALMDAATARAVPVVEVRRGERLRVGDLTLEVLNPTHRRAEDLNDESVALLLRWRERPWALLLGDISAAVEADLAVPPTPILLAPHHGSATSTSNALLRAAKPREVWISVGVNRYGHPSAAVLSRLDAAGIPHRSTLRDGNLRAPPPRLRRARRRIVAAARARRVRPQPRDSVNACLKRFACCHSGVFCASSWRAGTTAWWWSNAWWASRTRPASA